MNKTNLEYKLGTDRFALRTLGFRDLLTEDFLMHGRLAGNERGEMEAWYGHSWSESRDYIILYIYWVIANWYSFVKVFKTTNYHNVSVRSDCPFFIILTPFESQLKSLFIDITFEGFIIKYLSWILPDMKDLIVFYRFQLFYSVCI